MTHLRCGGKYDTSLVANLLLSPTVKEFLKSINTSQSYERISSGTCFMARSVHCVSKNVSIHFYEQSVKNVPISLIFKFIES